MLENTTFKVYSLFMVKDSLRQILNSQVVVLKMLAGSMDGFYLVGGTALCRGYFHHRDSYDLDFFTKDYSTEKIDGIIDLIRSRMRKKIKKSVDSNPEGKGKLLRMRRYEIPLGKGEPLKIDFVNDPVDLLQSFNRVEGIDFASLDDIYLRKIYAVSGIIAGRDRLGRIQSEGKRQEARDLFDLYHLSQNYKRLVVFVREYSDRLELPAIVQWYHSLNKIEMSFGFGDIITANPLEFSMISRHFRKEIDELIAEIN